MQESKQASQPFLVAFSRAFFCKNHQICFISSVVSGTLWLYIVGAAFCSDEAAKIFITLQKYPLIFTILMQMLLW